MERVKRELGFDGGLIKVGFWKFDGFAKRKSETGHKVLDLVAEILFETITAPLPSVFDHVDHQWDPKERKEIVIYLTYESFRGTSYLGHSTCRLCGKDNGSADYTDGEYVWPEGLAHYVRDHDVRPPPEFVRFALRRMR